jgi:hypothetical protein
MAVRVLSSYVNMSDKLLHKSTGSAREPQWPIPKLSQAVLRGGDDDNLVSLPDSWKRDNLTCCG